MASEQQQNAFEVPNYSLEADLFVDISSTSFNPTEQNQFLPSI
jgi:hypothetical protein